MVLAVNVGLPTAVVLSLWRAAQLLPKVVVLAISSWPVGGGGWLLIVVLLEPALIAWSR